MEPETTMELEPVKKNPDVNNQKKLENQKKLATNILEQFGDYIKFGLSVMNKLPNYTETAEQKESVEKTAVVVKTMLNNFMNIGIQFKEFLTKLYFLMLAGESIQKDFLDIIDVASQLERANKQLLNHINGLKENEEKMNSVFKSCVEFTQNQMSDKILKESLGKEEIQESLKKLEEIDAKVKLLRQEWDVKEETHNKSIIEAKNEQIKYGSTIDGFKFLEESQSTQVANLKRMIENTETLINSNQQNMSSSNQTYADERKKQCDYFVSQNKAAMENLKEEFNSIRNRTESTESQIKSNLAYNQDKINSTNKTNRKSWVKTNCYVEGQFWNRYVYYEEIPNLERERYERNKDSMESAQRFNQENRDRNLDLAKKSNRALSDSLKDMNERIMGTVSQAGQESQGSYQKLIDLFSQKKDQMQNQYGTLCKTLADTKEKKSFAELHSKKMMEEVERLTRKREDDRNVFQTYLDEAGKNYKEEKDNIKRSLEQTGHKSASVFIDFIDAISLFYQISIDFIKFCSPMSELIKQVKQEAILAQKDIKEMATNNEADKLIYDEVEREFLLEWTVRTFPKNLIFQKVVENDIATIDAMFALLTIKENELSEYGLNRLQFATLRARFNDQDAVARVFDSLKNKKFAQRKVKKTMNQLLHSCSFPNLNNYQESLENLVKFL